MAGEIIIEFRAIVVHGLPYIVLGRNDTVITRLMVGEIAILAVEIFSEHGGVDCSGGSRNGKAARGGSRRWVL